MLQEREHPLTTSRYTVIGFWFDDLPIAVGTIEGDNQVGGGTFNLSEVDGQQGPWALAVDADSIGEAERAAVREQLQTIEADDALLTEQNGDPL